MTKRQLTTTRVAIAFTILLTTILLVVILLKPQAPSREMGSYQGKTTTEWRQVLVELGEKNGDFIDPYSEFPLLQHPEPDAIPVLLDLLEDKKSTFRWVAQRALCRMGPQSEPAVPWLIHFLKSSDKDVRCSAAAVLGSIGEKAQDAVPALLKTLRDREPSVRLEAAEAVYRVTGNMDLAVPTLVRHFQDNDDCQFSAAYFLAHRGPASKSAVPALIARLKDQRPPPSPGWDEKNRLEVVHRGVLEALAAMGPEAMEALPAIKEALKDRGGFVRASAAVAYWKVTGESAVPIASLVELLQGSDPWPKSWAVDGLGRIGESDKEAVPPLVAVLEDKEAGWRAALILCKISPESTEPIPALIIIVNGKGIGTFSNRKEAIEGLGRIGPKANAAVPHLLEVLDEDDENLRKAAMEALEKIDPETAARLK